MRYYRGIIISYSILLLLSVLFCIGKLTSADVDFNTFGEGFISFDEFLMFVFMCLFLSFEGKGRLTGLNDLMYQNYPRKKVYCYKQTIFFIGFLTTVILILLNIIQGADILFIAKHLYVPFVFLLFMAYGNFTVKPKFSGWIFVAVVTFAFIFGILIMAGHQEMYWELTLGFLIGEGFALVTYIVSLFYAYHKKVKAYSF